MGKKHIVHSKRKHKPVEILMAIMGIGFLAVAILVVILLFTHGCSLVHYPLDLEQPM